MICNQAFTDFCKLPNLSAKMVKNNIKIKGNIAVSMKMVIPCIIIKIYLIGTNHQDDIFFSIVDKFVCNLFQGIRE